MNTDWNITGLVDLLEQVRPEEWQDRALCAQTDPEAFFPEKGGSTRDAKRICQGCEVKDECLEYALTHDEYAGIWGGMSAIERRKMKNRQLPPAPTPLSAAISAVSARKQTQDGVIRTRLAAHEPVPRIALNLGVSERTVYRVQAAMHTPPAAQAA